MPAAMGTDRCPEVHCTRRVHVTPGGTRWARCIACGLALMNRSAFSDSPSGARQKVVPPASLSSSRRGATAPLTAA